GPDIPGILGLKGVLEASVDGRITPKPYSENLEVVSVGSMAGDPDISEGAFLVRRFVEKPGAQNTEIFRPIVLPVILYDEATADPSA
ncbi:MAG: hypothetical protein QNK40_14415, partial [Desulfobacterales bacterium]|nr:hypothetical protein [Desulfobacterales bacterium]